MQATVLSHTSGSHFLKSCFFLFGCILYFLCPPPVLGQEVSPTPQASPGSTPQNLPKTQSTSDEIISHDIPATFKVRVNFVLVRVVVRDSNGRVIPNLKKEDFQLEDNRKLQSISSFSLETPASHIPTVEMDSAQPSSEGVAVKVPSLPQRFVALFFDDLHLATSDVMSSRKAAMKLLAALQPGDRIGIFSTSGQMEQDFTADHRALETALQRLSPHPLSRHSPQDCPPMTLYEAYQIVEVHDQIALRVATQDASNCTSNSVAAGALAQQAAQVGLEAGESELQFSFRNLDTLIHRMTALPGQRVIVMMSPGFFVTPSMRQSSDIIDRATKANIVINTIDARGLYVSSVYDAATPGGDPLRTEFIAMEESIQNGVLAELSDGTGGLFIHNRNDIDEGLLQAAAEPDVSYVLGFSPQNLKLDGKYHHLKVTLTNGQKGTLLARHGYFAPRGESDPEATAKEEVQQAIFSQEELRELPIQCQTRFFRGANSSRLTVITRLDTKGLKFHKSDGLNTDKLTVATAIFDQNGNLLTGLERTIDLKLKDASVEKLNTTGIGVKFDFDLQPGTFLVRIVVRDSEGAQMAAMNRGAVIP
jgi:VWFA-related protein